LVLALLIAGGGCGTSADDAASTSDELGDPARYAKYAKIVRDAGGDLTPGHLVVLGLRGRDADGTLHDTHTAKVFDDTMVLLRDGTATELSGSTHPWFTRNASPPDVNGDGIPDVAMIRPGRYQAVPRPAARNIGGMATFHVVTLAGGGSLPAWRDTNHDGSYDSQERAASEARHDTAGSILFHLGGLDSVPAIGCQVLPHDPLAELVTTAGGASFDYVLVDAHDVVHDLP
jgi:hypothetical protein